MNIYIKLEILSRELKSKMLLGMYAASCGHDVIIGDNELLKLIENKKLNPGIILEKSITPAKSRIDQLEKYKFNKSIVTCLDEETPLSTDNLDLFCKVRFSEKTLNLSDKVFCWSNFDLKILEKNFPKYKKKFVVTGNPRFELWKPQYKNLYNSKNIKKKRYIMISSNIGIGLWTMRYSSVIQLMRDNGYFANKEYEKYFYNWMKFNFNLLQKFTSAIDYLTKRFPNYNFVVRPHPSESVENWENVLKKRKNLIISKNLDHSYWIQNSEIIIHNGCTGGIEGFVRNKKVIAFKPTEDDGVLEFANQFGHIAKNELELGNIVETIYDKEEVKKLNNDLYDKLISRYDDFLKFNSIKNIINEWEKFNTKELSKKNNLLFIKIKNILRFVKYLLIKPRKNEKFAVFEKNKIFKLFNQLKKTDQILHKVHIELIGPKLLKFRVNK